MGLPNFITLTRFIAIGAIAWFYLKGEFAWALLALVYGGVSDVVDGTLARFLGQRTKLGAILDPAADKTLMMVCYLTLAWAGQVPYWFAGLIILRDIYIVTGVFILKFRFKKIFIRPTYVSKMTTFFQIFFIGLTLTKSYLPFSNYDWMKDFSPFISVAWQVSFYMTLLFTVASGIHYTLVGLAIYRGNLQPQDPLSPVGRGLG